MRKNNKCNNKYMPDQATETAMAIVNSNGASDPDPEFRRYTAGVRVLQRHFTGVDHAVRSRKDWPRVCQMVVECGCGFGADELLEGLLLAVQVEKGDVGDQTPEPSGPPTSSPSAPLDTAEVLAEFSKWAEFLRQHVPVPKEFRIQRGRNTATDEEIARILGLTGGVFSLDLTPAERRALRGHLCKVIRAGKILRRFHYEQEHASAPSEGDLGANSGGNVLLANEARP